MKKKAISLFLALTLVLSLTACSNSDNGTAEEPVATKTETQNSEEAEEEGLKEIIISEQWTIDSVDPVSQGKVMNQKCRVTELLVETDERMNLIPGLASSWENTDENTWIFKIQEGIQFHDGTALNAEAVKWSLDNAFEISPSLVKRSNIESVEATGDYEITIKTTQPNAELPAYLHDASLGIVAASTYDADGNVTTPIGTGPFRFESFDEAKGELSVVKNEEYWGTLPTYNRLVIRMITDESVRAMSVESGEVDIAVDVPFSEMEALDSKDDLRVECYDTNRIYYGYFNAASMFSDKNVRQAICYAIDRDTISKEVLYGCGTPASGPFNSSIAWSNPEIEGYKYNPDKALELLKEVGWEDTDGDGILDKDGKSFSFDILTFSSRPGLPVMAQAMQAMLSEIGIQVEVKVMDNNAINEEMEKSDTWGINLTTAAAGLVPSSVYFLNSFSSANTEVYGYSNLELDEMLAACAAEYDQDKRYEMSKEIQAYIVDEAEEIFVCNYGVNYVFHENITNFKFNVEARDWMLNTDIEID